MSRIWVQVKGQYNHFDSYIEWLGKDIIKTLNSIPKEDSIRKLNEVYDNITLVDEDDKPTQEMINAEFESSIGYSNMIKQLLKIITKMALQRKR